MPRRPVWPPSLVLAAALTLSACPPPARAAIRFTDQAASAGITERGEGNGAAFGDYDGDGWPDLLVTCLGLGEQVLLYRNNGDGTFADGRGQRRRAARPARPLRTWMPTAGWISS